MLASLCVFLDAGLLIIVSNINDVPNTSDSGGTAFAKDRRRSGRRDYSNPHLIGLMRLQDDESGAVYQDEPEERMTALRTRPFVALTVACLVFWGVVALLIVKL